MKDRVEEHPEIKAKIEERIRNVAEANRERAFINAAKTEAMNQTVRPVGNAVRP
jgi:low affinity Fe/Cu permease